MSRELLIRAVAYRIRLGAAPTLSRELKKRAVAYRMQESAIPKPPTRLWTLVAEEALVGPQSQTD